MTPAALIERHRALCLSRTVDPKGKISVSIYRGRTETRDECRDEVPLELAAPGGAADRFAVAERAIFADLHKEIRASLGRASRRLLLLATDVEEEVSGH